MRPRHPHAAESGVGKHIARESESVKACAAGTFVSHEGEFVPWTGFLSNNLQSSGMVMEEKGEMVRVAGSAKNHPGQREKESGFSRSNLRLGGERD